MTRWSGQDYPLNMASLPQSPRWKHCHFKAAGGINTCSSVSNRSPRRGVRMFSLCVCVCSCVSVRPGKGYSNICGLSFDPAALKHTAPPTLVLSCVSHICAVAQISRLAPQASAAGRGRCLAQASPFVMPRVLLICSRRPHPLR